MNIPVCACLNSLFSSVCVSAAQLSMQPANPDRYRPHSMDSYSVPTNLNCFDVKSKQNRTTAAWYVLEECYHV